MDCKFKCDFLCEHRENCTDDLCAVLGVSSVEMKSHTISDIWTALENGKEIWTLDSPEGDNDTWIQDPGEDEESMLREFYSWKFDYPSQEVQENGDKEENIPSWKEWKEEFDNSSDWLLTKVWPRYRPCK